jgi:RNA polymerase sigma-70 factor (ECF subfamily)
MSDENVTSVTLLERVRRRDQDAWQRLLHLYTPLVAYWCRHEGVLPQDADDVCQDVFQAVAAGLPGFRRDHAGETFRGWLRGITRHKVLDYFRRRQGQPEAQGGTDAQLRLAGVPQSEASPPEADDPEDELIRLYHRALELVRGEFEARTWQAFWRAAVEGRAPAELAAELGMTPAAVRKAKSRVLLRLREEVGDLIQ